MKVNKKEIIEEKIIQNQGIIQIADIVTAGISKQYAIKYLQDRNCERVAKGVYLASDTWQDDLYIISLQYKKNCLFSRHCPVSARIIRTGANLFYSYHTKRI